MILIVVLLGLLTLFFWSKHSKKTFLPKPSKKVPVAEELPFSNDVRKNVIPYNGREIIWEKLEEGGWILREFLTREEQIHLCKDTIERLYLGRKSVDIHSAYTKVSFPTAHHNLTSETDFPYPEEWFKLSGKAWNIVSEHCKDFDGPNIGDQFNSFHAQLFHEQSMMEVNKDHHSNWGVSFNLGASILFYFGGRTITLHGGDVLIADFSKIDHGVRKVLGSIIPACISPDNDIIELSIFGRVGLI